MCCNPEDAGSRAFGSCKCSTETLYRRLRKPTEQAFRKSQSVHYFSEHGQTRLSTQSLALPEPVPSERDSQATYTGTAASLRRARLPDSTLRAMQRATSSPAGYLPRGKLKAPSQGMQPRRLDPIELICSAGPSSRLSPSIALVLPNRGRMSIGHLESASWAGPATTGAESGGRPLSRPSLSHVASVESIAPRAHMARPHHRKPWTPLEFLHSGPARSDDFYLSPKEKAAKARAMESHLAASKLQAVHRGQCSRKLVMEMKSVQQTCLGELQAWLAKDK